MVLGSGGRIAGGQGGGGSVREVRGGVNGMPPGGGGHRGRSGPEGGGIAEKWKQPGNFVV